MKNNKGRCYCCGAPATSEEHVPPKGLFPKAKDIPNTKFREKLITVPSCEKHNPLNSDFFYQHNIETNMSSSPIGICQLKKRGNLPNPELLTNLFGILQLVS